MLQRDGILFKRGLIPALLLTLLLALACALSAFAVMSSAREKAAPVQVAVVDEEGGIVSRLAVNLVSSQSFIASLMDMTQTKRADALAGLEDGRYAAVIILPDGYTDHIRHGTEGEGQILLSQGAAASADIIASLAKFGELLLAAGQNGVFAGEQIIAEKGLSDSFHLRFLEQSNDELIDQAFSLYDRGITRREAPYSGTGISAGAYYAVAWISFFLLISGLFFGRLYTADTHKSMLTRLFSLGVSPLSFFAGKLIYPLAFRLPLLIGILAALHAFLPLSISPFSCILALLSLLMASWMISCCGVAMGDKKGWEGILLGLSAVGLFFSGGMIPFNMLPSWVTEIGRFTPFGGIVSGLKPLWGGPPDYLSILVGLVTCLALGYWVFRHIQGLPQRGIDA